eukprot:1041085-Pelagomonas_calceolata.AAC.1
MPSVTSRAMPFAVHCYIGSEAKCPLDHACNACFGVHHHIGHGLESWQVHKSASLSPKSRFRGSSWQNTGER